MSNGGRTNHNSSLGHHKPHTKVPRKLSDKAQICIWLPTMDQRFQHSFLKSQTGHGLSAASKPESSRQGRSPWLQREAPSEIRDDAVRNLIYLRLTVGNRLPDQTDLDAPF